MCMARPLPPLPEGFSWRRRGEASGELRLWGVHEMATVRQLPTGRWLAKVNLAFHESLHRQAVAASKGQACYWVHCWAAREALAIYKLRPRTCTIAEAMGPPVQQKNPRPHP